MDMSDEILLQYTGEMNSIPVPCLWWHIVAAAIACQIIRFGRYLLSVSKEGMKYNDEQQQLYCKKGGI